MPIDAATPGTPEFEVQFMHVLATDYGIGDAEVAELRAQYAAAVAAQAERIRAEWSELLAELPFAPGDTITVVGDSMTDDLQSWAYLLEAVLAGLHGEHAPRVINLGRSGDTSAQLIERFREVAATDPDWLVLMIGNNDAKAFASAPDTPLVSPGETGRNIALLDRLARDTGAEVTWMAEPRVEPALVASLEQWTEYQLVWSNDLVDATRSAVLAEVDAVDLEPAFAEGGRGLYLPDGLHPSLAGQVVILRALLESLVD